MHCSKYDARMLLVVRFMSGIHLIHPSPSARVTLFVCLAGRVCADFGSSGHVGWPIRAHHNAETQRYNRPRSQNRQRLGEPSDCSGRRCQAGVRPRRHPRGEGQHRQWCWRNGQRRGISRQEIQRPERYGSRQG